MRAPSVDAETLLDRLTEVFREHGFEGASLTRLVEASGLQRASLYHRYPGGKAEIAQAVLERVGTRLYAMVLLPLDGDGPARARVKAMARGLRHYYRDGKASCLLDALSFGDGDSPLVRGVRDTFILLQKRLASVAKESGCRPADARRRAQDAVIRIQGSLVLARASGDTSAFRRVLDALPDILVGDGEG